MKRVVLLFAALVGLFSACVNDELQESVGAGVLAGLDAQIKAVEGSVQDIEVLNAALGEMGLNVDEAEDAMAGHLAFFKEGATLEEGTLATLELQKETAYAVGAVEGTLLHSEDYNDLSSLFEDFHRGASLWLGDGLSAYYTVVLAHARIMASDPCQQLGEQNLHINALLSDVQAGLRQADASEELLALVGSVQTALTQAESLAENISALAADVEKEYRTIIKSLTSDPSSFDGDAMAEFNTSVLTKADAAEATLLELAGQVSKCKEELVSLQERLSLVEGAVGDLLAMIQSVTFMPQLPTKNAAAYYSMDPVNKVSNPDMPYYGKAQRKPEGMIELDYIIRPAAASAALASNPVAVSVIGYYAGRISTMSVDPSDYIDFELDQVLVVDADRGVVKVVVKPQLKEDFYYKETGAKCALSIRARVTDIVSRFVDIVPVDNGSDIYVTGIAPSERSVEMDKGDTRTLSAVVTPSNATKASYSWSSSDEKVVTVNKTTGLLTAVGVGEATVTVTSDGVDEWGLPLTAECRVKVNEAFRLSGPAYVEVGYGASLSLDHPASAVIQSKTWTSSDPSKASVDENGKVTGVATTYQTSGEGYSDVTITCTVNGVVVVSHNMKVVVPQPKSVRTANLADDQSSVSIKVDEKLSLASTIYPENVDPSHFRLYYSSDQGLGWINASTGMINEYGNQMSPCSAWVYIDVLSAQSNSYFAPGASLRRTVVVKVEPYYVTSIKFDDIKMQPDQTVALNPVFGSDVSGKQPTNTTLAWSSDNEAVAVVNQNGVVTALSSGAVKITATATDGTGVSGTCTIEVTQSWKEFEVKDYVVRTTDGGIDFAADYTAAVGKGTVVGVVIAKTNPRATDPMLPETCTHGIAVALGEGEGNWWSAAPESAPYKLYEWATQNGYQSTMGVDWNASQGTYRAGTSDKYVGYNNTLALQAFIPAKGLSSEMVDALNEYRRQGPALPEEASQYYLPSIAEMDAIAAVSNMSWNLSNLLSAAGGTKFTNAAYWTVSDSGNSSSNAAKVNPLTGALEGAGIKTGSAKFRYVFAF